MIVNYKNIKIYYKIYNKQNNSFPVLFLHGWEGSIASFDYFCKKLSKTKTVFNLDFPPFGKSSSPLRPLTIEDYANIVIAILKANKIRKVDIVAHSFGGRVAIYLASTTNFVNKLLLTGCAGIRKKSFKSFFKIKKYKCLKFLSKIKMYPKHKLNEMGSEEYKKLSPVMKHTFTNVVNYDQTKQLSKIASPTLLVWGSLDKETPFYFTKIFKKNIKDCEVIEFENCSHFAYLEKPDLFLKILLSYFN